METVKEGIECLKEYSGKYENVTLGLAAIGGAYLITNALCKLSSIYKYFIRPSLNLKARYGDGWAVVTGASDGIGKAYAFELAKRGFKVGLIARNKEKLDKVADEIKQNFGVEVKTVVFDFDWDYTDGKINELKEKLEAFDHVSILVNNVGIANMKSIHDYTFSQIKSIINVNAIGFTMINKLLFNKLLSNPKKSGIINIGSAGTEYVFPGFNIYSSTKSYVTMLSKSITIEYSDKIDWMLATVGPTKTNMSLGLAFLSSYPESVVWHTLNTLGRESHTYGDWRHALRCYLLRQKLTSSLVIWKDTRNKRLHNSS